MKSRARSLATVAALVALVALAAGASRAQDASSKERKVRKLLELNGSAELSKTEYEDICKRFAGVPNLPKGFEEAFRKETQASDLVDMLVPVYAKNLDDETLDALVAFYSTPAGKKFAAAQPAILKASETAGAEWVQGKMVKVLEQLDADAGKKKKDAPKKPIPGEGD
jgi:hypothetical protein